VLHVNCNRCSENKADKIRAEHNLPPTVAIILCRVHCCEAGLSALHPGSQGRVGQIADGYTISSRFLFERVRDTIDGTTGQSSCILLAIYHVYISHVQMWYSLRKTHNYKILNLIHHCAKLEEFSTSNSTVRIMPLDPSPSLVGPLGCDDKICSSLSLWCDPLRVVSVAEY
jgi:hypothetical protein